MAGVEVDVTYEGVPELKEAMRDLNPDLHPEPIQKAILRSARITRQLAKWKYIRRGPFGPVHPTRLTSRSGRLRRSIEIDESGLPQFVAYVGTDVPYGSSHEFGDRGLNLRPRPFMGPAWEETIPQMPDIFIDEWRKAVRQQ